MLEFLDLSNEKLKELKYYSKGNESNIFVFKDGEKKYIIKIFKNHSHIKNKIKKITLIKNRLKKINYVVKADKIVKINGKIAGYSMPYINGISYIDLYYNRKKYLVILKKLSEILKKLHKQNIICADFHKNFIIDKNNEVYLIDHDNFAIDDFHIDLENIYLKNYKKNINKLDSNFDNYLLNLLTISYLVNIYLPDLYFKYNNTQPNFKFNDEEINSIIYNTLNLKNIYNEDLIIDKIYSNINKKIKRKRF